MNDLTAAVLCDRCCTRLRRSIRSSPSGSSSSCSFPSDSHATHHQIALAPRICRVVIIVLLHISRINSECPSNYRRGSTRSSYESTCCHRGHPSRRQSTCHDSHTGLMNCSSCHALDFLDVSDSLTNRATTDRSHSCLALSQDRAMTHQSHTLFVPVQGWAITHQFHSPCA